MIPAVARFGVRLLLPGLAFACWVSASPVLAAGRGLVPVPTVTIYPGDVIGNDLLTMRRVKQRYRSGRSSASRRRIYGSREFLVGKVARRTLLPGRAIPRNAVRAPDVVARGKSVLVSYRSGRLLITAYATALQSGRPGDIVSLRNIDNGSIISGRVLKDGTIQLSGAH